MVGFTWPLVSLALLTPLVRGWDHVSADELDASSRDHNVAVVAFVTPAEAKSIALEAEWAAAASKSSEKFLSIDCTYQTAACEQYGVSSYPSVKVLYNGQAKVAYEGARTASAILSWSDRVLRPTVSHVSSESAADFKGSDESVFVAYLNLEDAASREVFNKIALQYREEFTFGINTDPDAAAAEGVEVPAVKCHRAVDGDVQTHKGQFDLGSLESFVKEASRPLIGELTQKNHQRFLDRGWPMIYVFAETAAERAELRTSLVKMARSYYESLTMVTVDPLEFPDLPAKLGLEPGAYPAGAVHQLSKNRIYPYPKGQQVTSGELQKWGLDVWQGRIKAWTPPGETPAPDDGSTPGVIKATRKVSMGSFGGVKIKIGRDEL